MTHHTNQSVVCLLFYVISVYTICQDHCQNTSNHNLPSFGDCISVYTLQLPLLFTDIKKQFSGQYQKKLVYSFFGGISLSVMWRRVK